MFKPLFLYIGLRYTRAKRRNHFISFISLMSMLGIALGVMVLITVLSVMNGFDQQIQQRIFAMVPHITVTGPNNMLTDWRTVADKLSQSKGILGTAPYINAQGLLTSEGFTHPAFIVGILPEQENKVSELAVQMRQGQLSALQPGKFNIILGEGLADSLGVGVGDKVNLLTSQASITPVGVLPRYKRFTVVGIFHAGNGFGFDEGYAFIHLQDAQALFATGSQVSGVQLKVGSLFAAPAIANKLQQSLGYNYQVSDWTQQYGGFFHAVQMEKTMMFFLLLLLVAIAAFNLVSGLVMAVNDKQADIAILRTFGATPRLIMAIFMVQGTVVGFFGTLLGVISGILLSLNATQLVNFIQNTFQVQLLTSDVYFVNYLPSQLQMMDVYHVSVMALLLSLLATIYPAWRAAKVEPVEALRYE